MDRFESVAVLKMKTGWPGEELVYDGLQNHAKKYGEHIFLNTYPIESNDYNFLCVIKGQNSDYLKSFVESMADVVGIDSKKVIYYREGKPAS